MLKSPLRYPASTEYLFAPGFKGNGVLAIFWEPKDMSKDFALGEDDDIASQ